MTFLSRFRRRRVDCRHVAQQLQSYLDGELDDAQMHQIGTHLEACRDCGLELTTYEAIKDSLHREALPLDDRVVERLRAFGVSFLDGGGPPTTAATMTTLCG